MKKFLKVLFFKSFEMSGLLVELMWSLLVELMYPSIRDFDLNITFSYPSLHRLACHSSFYTKEHAQNVRN